MSSEIISRIEDLVAELKSSIESLRDGMFHSQLRLGAGILANAVDEAKLILNPARVSDIEFALSDLVQIVDGLSAAASERIGPTLQLLQQELGKLKQTVSLAPELLNRIRDFQEKLRERRAAIERQIYRPQGSAPEPPPHDPGQLRVEAELLSRALAVAGFISPMLDQLISEPDSVRLHHLSAIIDELDVMVGSES